MTELVKYSKIGVQDLNNGSGTFEVTLADGRVVTMDQVSLNALNALFPLTVTATGGLTARILPNHLGARITVTDFGNETSMPLGVATAQVALAAAVAHCFTNDKDLYWPAGTYLSTATIPNFHDVRHRGPGILKRGSDLFYVDPSSNGAVTNNLYVATTGSNTNDGLTSSEPRLGVQSMGNVIYGYEYGLTTWTVNLAAGTYSSTSVYFPKNFPSPFSVIFQGPTVASGVQPTAIFVAATPTTDTYGFYFQSFVLATVKHINFKNFRAGASPAPTLLGSGIIADGRSVLYTINVWCDDCDQGIFVTNGSEARIQAGRFGFNNINGAGVQFIRHSHGTVGYAGTLADVTGATGTALIGGSYGVLIQEMSMAHTDTCYFNTQTLAGVAVFTNARCHSVSSTYLSCAVGIDARNNANLGATTNTFTSCTVDTILRSGARSSSDVWQDSTDFTPTTKIVQSLAQTTQSAAPIAITMPGGAATKAFAAKEFQNRGMGFEFRIYGNCTGVVNTKTIVVNLNATTILTATIAAATLQFFIRVKMVEITTASQYVYTEVQQSGVLPTCTLTTTITENLAAASTLSATMAVTNVADLIRVGMLELEMQH